MTYHSVVQEPQPLGPDRALQVNTHTVGAQNCQTEDVGELGGHRGARDRGRDALGLAGEAALDDDRLRELADLLDELQHRVILADLDVVLLRVPVVDLEHLAAELREIHEAEPSTLRNANAHFTDP